MEEKQLNLCENTTERLYNADSRMKEFEAKVLSCEEVPKANKLLKFNLKVGNEERVIVSGIKKWYKPEDLVGKNVLIIANLKPRKIMGIESKGMILSAAIGEELSVTTTLDPEFKNGSEVC